MKIIKLFYLVIFVFSVFLISCKQKVNSPYPGFDKTPAGVFYRRITIGDGTFTPKKGDSLYLKVVFCDTTGRVIFDTESDHGTGVLGLLIDSKTEKNYFENALTTMVEGDSTQFIINADSLYNQSFNIQLPSQIKAGSLLYVFANLYKHKRAEQIIFEQKQFEKWSKEMQEIEYQKLNEYLNKNKLTVGEDSSGLYILKIKKGSGKPIYTAGSALIFIKGTLLDGTEVENTYPPNEPLEFFSGQSGQVNKAIEIILSRIKIGGQAEFIAPSKLAYGSLGSSTGIVPPFASIKYVLEVK